MPNPQVKNQDIVDSILQHEKYREDLLYCTSYDLFYLYEDGVYRELLPEAMAATVWKYLIAAFPDKNITKQVVMDIIAQLKWGCKRRVDDMNSPYIAFTDKLYNCETFEFEDFDQQRIATHRLQFASEELQTPCPRWQQFLKEVLVLEDTKKEDPELVILIQEIFGFYLLPNMKAEKVFFLVGEGANGKSKMLNVLESMLGPSQVSSMSVETLTLNHFATSALIGKKLNICNEEESKYLRSDRFKALVSGDRVDGERKFGDRFSFKPTTKYIFATNGMPTFDGLNVGLRRRIVIIPFHRIFSEEEQDKNLLDKLLPELPGIIGWVLIGAKKLVEQKYIFSHSRAVLTSATEFESAISSPLMYFREHWRYDISNEQWISTKELYEKYTAWCIEVGKKSMSRISFLRELQKTIGLKNSVPHRMPDGTTSRGVYIKPLEIEVEGEPKSGDDIWEELTNAVKS